MTHNHEHDDHNHVHAPAWKGGSRYFIASILLSVFAIIEGYLGTIVLHSPLVVADAGHNLSDVAFAFATGIVAIVALVGRSSHFVGEHVPLYASIIISIATIIVITVAVVLEAFEDPPTALIDIVLTAALGLASYLVNTGLARYLQQGHNALAQATAQHFRSDAKVSLILVPTAILAGLLSLTQLSWLPRSAILVGTIAVLIKTSQDNLAQARTFAYELGECRKIDRANGHRAGEELA